MMDSSTKYNNTISLSEALEIFHFIPKFFSLAFYISLGKAYESNYNTNDFEQLNYDLSRTIYMIGLKFDKSEFHILLKTLGILKFLTLLLVISLAKSNSLYLEGSRLPPLENLGESLSVQAQLILESDLWIKNYDGISLRINIGTKSISYDEPEYVYFKLYDLSSAVVDCRSLLDEYKKEAHRVDDLS